MAFFQHTVTDKYLSSVDKLKIQEKYILFKAHFHNSEVQQNIRNSKEEQYQEGFLRDLFVAILGYTLNPQNNFNLTTEYKNIKDSKKADGAILIADKVRAVIELKGTDTTDLGKVETQAFGYKNNQPDCVYVITSNFEKLRFYIDNAIDHLEFNLFTLSEKDFELLYLCLAHENLEKGIAKKIKDESISQEDTITKKLYKDYSLFKRELHQNLVQLNPQYNELELFKKSQKLLDRFLFLFFAEDRQLLPPNSVRLILNDWRELQERDEEVPLFNRFRKYFGYLNTGFKGKRYDVFAYNGGLFKPDDILDAVKIDDELLYKHTFTLSEYNFASEVDVNILGHIFENSLNELDEIKAQLEGQEIDKTKTKRKKDGVFYTPKYITKYIVENTVGKLCAEKKAELQINDADYTADHRIQKKTKQAHLDKLTTYREWLLQLTICDPACGSGAFLNQALDFLIAEHHYVDELQAKLFGDSLVLSDVEKSILEHNIFGVDLNEESVEIAKLSLWLRTAQPNRKLNDLNNNIKCGNSLIDDPEVAGDKAFNWQQAFPHVFEKGGFDVVIGNPPYVQVNDDFYNKYKTYKCGDLYAYFFEQGFEILNTNGLLSFITPSSYFTNLGYISLREFLLQFNIIKLIDLGENVFADASVDSGIIVVSKTFAHDNKIKCSDSSFNYSIIEKSFFYELDNKIFNIYLNPLSLVVANKILKKSIIFSDIIDFSRGVEFGFKSENVKSIQDVNTFPIVCGGNINRFKIDFENKFVNYDEKQINIYKSKDIYLNEKILVRRIGNSIISCFDDSNLFNVCDVYNLQIKENIKDISLKYISVILNCKLTNFYFDTKFKSIKKLFPKIPIQNLKLLPIQRISIEFQQPFIEKADLMLALNKELQEETQKFQRQIQREFVLQELPNKLQEWYLLTFAEFIKELEKKKVKLALAQKAEWEDYFLQEQAKAVAIKNQIEATDKEIDRMVYALYELTEEEIKIVEGV